jgi:hypothetical protein
MVILKLDETSDPESAALHPYLETKDFLRSCGVLTDNGRRLKTFGRVPERTD